MELGAVLWTRWRYVRPPYDLIFFRGELHATNRYMTQYYHCCWIFWEWKISIPHSFFILTLIPDKCSVSRRFFRVFQKITFFWVFVCYQDIKHRILIVFGSILSIWITNTFPFLIWWSIIKSFPFPPFQVFLFCKNYFVMVLVYYQYVRIILLIVFVIILPILY